MDILTQSETWLSELDSNGDLWAEAKSKYNKLSYMLKAKLAFYKDKFEGSEATRERQALNHPEYLKFIEEDLFNAELAFFKLDARRRFLETAIELARSKISYEKNMILKILILTIILK